MTKKLLEISDRTYEELVNIGKLIEQEDIERAGIKIRMTPEDVVSWSPEDVVSWLLGFASGANPQIHKIVFPNEKTREEEIGEMAKALGED